MRPWREVFALDYIDETVDAYARLILDCDPAPAGGCPEGLDPLEAWADDVLSRYFETCGAHPVLDRARSRFVQARRPDRQVTGAVPFPAETSAIELTIEDLQRLALRRRSVRWYQQRPVPREVIDRAIDVARYSPSACNRQPFEFRIFDDPDLVRQVGAIPVGVKGFDHNFPCIVVLVGRLRAYMYEYDRHLIYIDASLAAMAFLFALEVQGVSSCCINWSDRADREAMMNHLLGLAPDERVIMCISLGYADPEGLVPYSQKKSLDQLRSYNRTHSEASLGAAQRTGSPLEAEVVGS